MTIYVRRFEDCSTEVVLIQGGFRKKRYHLLINPQNLSLITDTQDGINAESVTHIVAVAPLGQSSTYYNNLFEIAELLNKPVIADIDTFRLLRGHGMPARQLRQIEHLDEIFPTWKVEVLNNNQMQFDSMPDAVRPTQEVRVLENDKLSEPLQLMAVSLKKTAVDPLRTLINQTFNLLFFPFKRWINISIPMTKRTKITEELEKMDEDPFLLLITFDETGILIPLNEMGEKHIIRAAEQYKPQIILFPDAMPSIIHSIKFDTQHIIILNKNNPSEKILRIPKSANPMLQFEITLANYGDWLEVA